MKALLPIFLALFGLLFFLPPLGVILYKLAFRLGCRKAEALVLRQERNRDPDTDSMLLQTVFEFFDENRGRREFKTGIGYGLRYMPRPGSRVKIYYRPESEPLRVQVASRGLWEVSAALMGAGLALMLPALVYFFLL